MKFPVKSFAVLMAAVAVSSSAHATNLLTLIDPTAGTSENFDLLFTATSTSSTLTDGGYQLPGFTDFEDNSVVDTSGGGDLLGQSWIFTPAPLGTDTSQFNDGTSVNGLSFGGVAVGSFDQYSQTFATTVGDTYLYSFNVPNFAGTPDGFTVDVTNAVVGTGGVPEPATWAMMLVGFGGLGAAMRSRRKLAGRVAA
jgi:PEP-CTERM motif